MFTTRTKCLPRRPKQLTRWPGAKMCLRASVMVLLAGTLWASESAFALIRPIPIVAAYGEPKQFQSLSEPEWLKFCRRLTEQLMVGKGPYGLGVGTDADCKGNRSRVKKGAYLHLVVSEREKELEITIKLRRGKQTTFTTKLTFAKPDAYDIFAANQTIEFFAYSIATQLPVAGFYRAGEKRAFKALEGDMKVTDLTVYEVEPAPGQKFFPKIKGKLKLVQQKDQVSYRFRPISKDHKLKRGKLYQMHLTNGISAPDMRLYQEIAKKWEPNWDMGITGGFSLMQRPAILKNTINFRLEGRRKITRRLGLRLSIEYIPQTKVLQTGDDANAESEFQWQRLHADIDWMFIRNRRFAWYLNFLGGITSMTAKFPRSSSAPIGYSYDNSAELGLGLEGQFRYSRAKLGFSLYYINPIILDKDFDITTYRAEPYLRFVLSEKLEAISSMGLNVIVFEQPPEVALEKGEAIEVSFNVAFAQFGFKYYF